MFGFPPSLLTPDFLIIVVSFQLTNVTQLAVPANPNRFAIWFEPDNFGTYFVSTRSALTVHNGWTVPNGGINWPITYNDVGPIVTLPFYCVSVNAGPITAFAHTVIYQPEND